MSPKSLEQRIAEIEDREAISKLLATYCQAFDGRDEAVYMSIWTESAVIDLGEQWGRAVGVEQIREHLHNNWAYLSETSHLSGNYVINVEGSEANAASDLMATGVMSDGTPIFSSTSNRDKLVKDKGQWKIVERRANIHYSAPIADLWHLVSKSK